MYVLIKENSYLNLIKNLGKAITDQVILNHMFIQLQGLTGMIKFYMLFLKLRSAHNFLPYACLQKKYYKK
jgi:hypothetical protein